VHAYTQIVRERLKKEDEEIRTLRKCILIRDCQKYEKIIFGKLMDLKVKPRWGDLVNILRIRESIEAGRYDELPKAPLIEAETVDEFEKLTREEADERLVKLFKQVDLPSEIDEKKN
jgi:hypothetical protein